MVKFSISSYPKTRSEFEDCLDSFRNFISNNRIDDYDEFLLHLEDSNEEIVKVVDEFALELYSCVQANNDELNEEAVESINKEELIKSIKNPFYYDKQLNKWYCDKSIYSMPDIDYSSIEQAEIALGLWKAKPSIVEDELFRLSLFIWKGLK